ELQLVGGYDIARPSKPFPFPVFASLERLLTTTRPDILVVATPPSSHVDLSRQALLAGCHVFCEKPLAEDLAGADELVEMSATLNRHVVVNSEFPYMPIHQAAKQAMKTPEFGRLLFMAAHQTFLVTPETEAGWRGQDRQRTLKEFGSHVLDLARF